MRKILTWSTVVTMLPALALAPVRCQAENQLENLLKQGALEMQNERCDQAIALFKQALKEEPQAAVTFNLLGMAYRLKYNQVRNQELKNQESAAFQKAVEIDPTYWIALINLGATYYHMGEKAKAAPLFKKALSLNPNHPERDQLEEMIREGEQKP